MMELCEDSSFMNSWSAEQIKLATGVLRHADPIMAEIIDQVGEFRLEVRKRGFPVIVQAIISQQISTAAAKTIFGRLQMLFPGKSLSPELIRTLAPEQFQAVGVSAQKQASLLDLVQKTLDGSVSFRRITRAADEEAIAELIQVRGIGRWTAQMYLIFSLGRPDVFAPDDLGLRNAMLWRYSLPESAGRRHFEELAERWRPYRSMACWYLWRTLELAE
jgi:DNA-3-methyladenine glycosylase II